MDVPEAIDEQNEAYGHGSNFSPALGKYQNAVSGLLEQTLVKPTPPESPEPEIEAEVQQGILTQQ